MSQGRIVYLGYRASYTNPYRIEVDYRDGSGLMRTFSSASFIQNPGAVFGISDLNLISSVRVYDSITGGLLGQYSAFTPDCGSCWPNASMLDILGHPVTITIAWNPNTRGIVLTDDDIFANPPSNDDNQQ